MVEKIWYQGSIDDGLTLNDVKELGVDGIYLTHNLKNQDEAGKQARKLGLEVRDQDELPFNQELTQVVLTELTNPAIPDVGFPEKIQKLLNTDEVNGLLNPSEEDQLLQMQALALMALLSGQLVIPANLINEKDSQNWRQIQKLITLRKAQNNLPSRINITENNLIELQKDKLTGYFNTSSAALGFNSVSSLIQNYLVGQLLPKGVVIREN